MKSLYRSINVPVKYNFLYKIRQGCEKETTNTL